MLLANEVPTRPHTVWSTHAGEAFPALGAETVFGYALRRGGVTDEELREGIVEHCADTNRDDTATPQLLIAVYVEDTPGPAFAQVISRLRRAQRPVLVTPSLLHLPDRVDVALLSATVEATSPRLRFDRRVAGGPECWWGTADEDTPT